MQSNTNTREADMVTALVSHLCRQSKYKPGEIAVLTPYVGQLRLFKDKLENIVDLVISEPDLAGLDELEGEIGQATLYNTGRALLRGSLLDQVRMATVDDFQVS
jgi:superfamily I DNA and/or RNA helicase